MKKIIYFEIEENSGLYRYNFLFEEKNESLGSYYCYKSFNEAIKEAKRAYKIFGKD